MSRTVYCLPDNNQGHDPCNILQEHWQGSGMKTILLSKDDFENLSPWQLVSLLNKAYACGRREYQASFRNFIGIE